MKIEVPAFLPDAVCEKISNELAKPPLRAEIRLVADKFNRDLNSAIHAFAVLKPKFAPLPIYYPDEHLFTCSYCGGMHEASKFKPGCPGCGASRRQ